MLEGGLETRLESKHRYEDCTDKMQHVKTEQF
jgi:hypothetical protein